MVECGFSRNRFGRWSLGEGLGLLGDNGEMNRIGGKRGWMEGGESVVWSGLLGEVKKIGGIIEGGMRESG